MKAPVEPIPTRIVILGAGMHGKVVAHTLRRMPAFAEAELIFLDDDASLKGRRVAGVEVVGGLGDYPQLVGDGRPWGAIVGVGNKHLRLRSGIFEGIRRSAATPVTARHPTAIVDDEREVGAGCYLGPGVIVNVFASVGENCVIYSGAVVEHECRLEDNVYVGPGVVFTAGVQVGRDTLIGAGSRLAPFCKVGSRVAVGAGSVVVADVADQQVVAGIPARPIGANRDEVAW